MREIRRCEWRRDGSVCIDASGIYSGDSESYSGTHWAIIVLLSLAMTVFMLMRKKCSDSPGDLGFLWTVFAGYGRGNTLLWGHETHEWL